MKYYLWCDRYTAQEDPNRYGCTFADPNNEAERYVGNTGWNLRYGQADRLHNDLRCTVHDRKPQVFQREYAYVHRINKVWIKVWDTTRVWVGPEEWRTRANIVRRRPAPATIRSTWNAAVLR